MLGLIDQLRGTASSYVERAHQATEVADRPAAAAELAELLERRAAVDSAERLDRLVEAAL